MTKLMKTEIFKKTGKNILEYLRKLGGMSDVYSARRQGLRPLLTDMEGYIYATSHEIIVVLVDPGTNKRFDEKEDMVWDLALTCELYRNRLQRLSKRTPEVYGVLLTADPILEQDMIEEARDFLDIVVFDRVEDLDSLSLPVNTDDKLPVAFPLDFLYQAEFSEADYAYAEYSLISLIDPDTTPEEREEEMNYLVREFGL